MKRYVLEREDGMYYQPGKDNLHIADNFVESVEDAYWYKTEQTALLPVHRYKLKVSVVELDITVRVGEKNKVKYGEFLEENKKLVAEWDALTPAEAEALPITEYRKYKKARSYVRVHSELV